MRKLVATFALVLLSLSAFAGTALAKPAVQSPTLASGAHLVLSSAQLAKYGVHSSIVGHALHITLPAEVDCSHLSTEWVDAGDGPRVGGPDVIVQDRIWIEVSVSGFHYCGYDQSQGVNDHLFANCHTFLGDTWDQYLGIDTSTYSVYHCTAGYYNLYGPVSIATCFYSSNDYELVGTASSENSNLSQVFVHCNSYN